MARTGLRLEHVTRDSIVLSSFVPPLGLVDNLDLDWRIYVLRCKPQVLNGGFTWYVGLVPAKDVVSRMAAHAAGAASDFTAANPPILVEFIHPAPSPAAEAYLFFAMNSKLSEAAIEGGRLGGWVQTRPKPSQLCRLLLKEQKRMIDGSCIACGDSWHSARDKRCPRKMNPESVPFACSVCQSSIHVTALGATTAQADAEGKSNANAGSSDQPVAKKPPSTAPLRETAVGSFANNKRPSDRPLPISGSSVAKVQKVSARKIPEVSICGHSYTTLSGYFGKDPNGRQRKAIALACGANAVELRNGNSQTLSIREFLVTPPKLARELLPGRVNMPSKWHKTACLSLDKHNPKDSYVELQRPGEIHACRHVLWRVEDLRGYDRAHQ